MTQEETKTIMNILFVSYPASYKDWTKGQFSTASNLWYEMFKTIPYRIMETAVKKELAANRTNFAPSIGEIMFQVKDLISVLDANTAWENICYIVRTVDFEKIPEAVRGLDEISRKIVTSRDIQKMKESSRAMDSFRPTFLSAYNREKDKRETAAVETGNLLSISSKEKMLQLGANPAELQIEMKQERNDG